MASVAAGGAAERIIERIFCNVPRAGWGSFARYFSTSAEPVFVLARADALAFFIRVYPGIPDFGARLPPVYHPIGRETWPLSQGSSPEPGCRPALLLGSSGGKSVFSNRGRISTTPPSVSGQRLAHSKASSRDFTWIIQNPAIRSLASANGPSVNTRL